MYLLDGVGDRRWACRPRRPVQLPAGGDTHPPTCRPCGPQSRRGVGGDHRHRPPGRHVGGVGDRTAGDGRRGRDRGDPPRESRRARQPDRRCRDGPRGRGRRPCGVRTGDERLPVPGARTDTVPRGGPGAGRQPRGVARRGTRPDRDQRRHLAVLLPEPLDDPRRGDLRGTRHLLAPADRHLGRTVRRQLRRAGGDVHPTR